jgi:hypothetical protein
MQPRTIRFAVLLVLNQSFVHRRRRVSLPPATVRAYLVIPLMLFLPGYNKFVLRSTVGLSC